MSDEEDRATEWRATQRRRAQYIATNEKRLRGSQSERKRLETNWAPITNRTQEIPTEIPEE
ncbi:MAG TPA: hypothetical protein VIM25_06250 [Candidatus Limnocylindrales bacterium]